MISAHAPYFDLRPKPPMTTSHGFADGSILTDEDVVDVDIFIGSISLRKDAISC